MAQMWLVAGGGGGANDACGWQRPRRRRLWPAADQAGCGALSLAYRRMPARPPCSGYFPTYELGALFACQIYEVGVAAEPAVQLQAASSPAA